MTFASVLTYTVFLPLIMLSYNAERRLGAYWWGKIDTAYMVHQQWAKIDVSWLAIEPTPGDYYWPDMLNLNVELLHRNRSPILLNFHNSPDWARDTDKPCTLPNAQSLDDYIRFILATIDRYHPQAIEIWNEPESNSDALSGWCCGCVADPAEYTNVLNAVYDAVKAHNQSVLVIGGALTQNNSTWAQSWLTTKPKMDAVSFHYYTYYYAGISKPSTAGLSARVADIQSRTSAPIWLTETALLCTLGAACTGDFRSVQDIWLQMVYPISGIDKVFWFSQNEVWWNKCNMVDERAGIIYPVFNSFMNLIK